MQITKIPPQALHTPNRRSLIVKGAQLALASSAGVPLFGRAQSSPVKLALIVAKQGPWADVGSSVAFGAQAAVEQTGQVLRRPIELIWLDEPNPQSAQQSMMRAIHQEKVVAVVGGQNSGTALALSATALSEKIPLISQGAAAREITGAKCHPYIFRDNCTVPTYARAMAPMAAAKGKRWYFLVGAYAFGADIYKTMQGELKARGGTEVGYDEAPVGTTDFSSMILKIRQARPDVVILGIAGSDLVAFGRQFAEFGLKGKIELCCLAIGDSDLRGMGEAASGTHGMLWHAKSPANSPDDAKLNAAVMAKFNRSAGQNEYMGWIAMRMMLAGIEKAGATDPLSIVRGLETVRLTNGIHYREWDHQLMHPLVVVRVKEKAVDLNDLTDVIDTQPKSPAGMDALHGSKEEVGCKMPPV